MLYKNKYLIALYDSDDFLLGVYDNIDDMCKKRKCTSSALRTALERKHNRLFLVDVYNIENDDFIETDLSLLEMYFSGDLTKLTNTDLAKVSNCSTRTIYRKKKVLKNGK